MAIKYFKRRAAREQPRSHVVLQVAAILIAIGALMKLYQMQSHRSDQHAFRHIRDEIDGLDISTSAKDTLKDVTKLARELNSEARDEVSSG
jgi:hypothetical protein